MGQPQTVLSTIIDSSIYDHRQRCLQSSTDHSKVTTGVFRNPRSMATNPAASHCRNARRLISRLTPYLATAPFGTATVRFPVFRVSCCSHSHNVAFRQLATLKALAAAASDTMANG